MSDVNKKIVDTVLGLSGADPFTLWRYYQDRADQIKERLWVTGTWLIAVGAAILAVPFTTDLVSLENSLLPFQTEKPIPVVLIAVFGVLFAKYSLEVVKDFVTHIESNWRRADYLKNDEIRELRLSTTGQKTLTIILILQLTANIGLALVATVSLLLELYG